MSLWGWGLVIGLMASAFISPYLFGIEMILLIITYIMQQKGNN